MPKRKPSNFFDVQYKRGSEKSPFILDLRKYEKGELKKNDIEDDINKKINARLFFEQEDQEKETEIFNHESLIEEGADIFSEDELSREKILEKLNKFEDYEVRLASMLNESDITGKEETKSNFILKLIPDRKNTILDSFSALTLKSNFNPLMQNTEAAPNNPFSSEFAADFSVSGVTSPGVTFGVTLPGEVTPDTSLDRTQHSASVIKRVGKFALVSSVACAAVFGAFYVQSVLDIKEKTVSESFLAYDKFRQAEESLKNLDFKKAAEDFSGAFESISQAKSSMNEIGDLTLYLAQNVPFDSRADSAISLLNAAKHIALAGENLSLGFSILPLDKILSPEHILNLFAQGENSSVEYSSETFERFNESLLKAEFEITAAKAELEKVNVSDFPQDLQANVGQLKQKVPLIASFLGIARDYSAISANLLGKDSSKRYLILFQNSSEIRPTGGFIGSYAVVELKDGRLVNMFVDGIYNADGRLTVNVIPPKPFEHITTAWSTHDANWFFDFPLSAEKVAWFYEQTGGGRIDGVFTVNVEVVENLLKITGPINLEGYDITLNSENFRDEIQYEVEVAYDKKLNRPKQILADFMPTFIDNLSKAVKNSSNEMLALVFDQLDKKNIMFYFRDENLQKFFDGQGWTGRVVNDQCPMIPPSPRREVGASEGQGNDQCTGPSDYLAVVHSNIGGYKTNKFIQNFISYGLDIEEDGFLTASVKLELKHSGGDTKYWWYNRSNIDYVKIYAPKGSELISYSGGLRRDDTEAPDYEALKFSKDPDVSLIESTLTKSGTIDIFNESDKTVFATWLITKPQKSTILEIRYRLPFKLEFLNGVSKYELKIQKQGGSEPNFNLRISTPKDWETEWNNLDALSGGSSFILNKDKIIGYIFKR